jgi:hypothetical protein
LNNPLDRLTRRAVDDAPPPAGTRPRALGLPAGLAPTLGDRGGRGAFRCEDVAAAALAGAPDALTRLERALSAYASDLPAHEVVDSSRRALDLSLALAALGPAAPASVVDATAAAVARHLARGEAHLPTAAAARCEALTNLCAAAMMWPTAPNAAGVRDRALAGLSEVGDARVRSDGTPIDGSPAEVLVWLEAALVLARLAHEDGLPVPDALAGAVGAAAWFLFVRSSGSGYLPPSDVGPVFGTPAAVLSAARDATLALGWSAGPAAEEHGAGGLARWWGGGDAGPCRALTSSADWQLWAFRQAPVLVARARPRTEYARGVVDVSGPGLPTPEVEVHGAIVMEAGSSTLEVDGSRSAPSLVRARVDPRQARAVVDLGAFTRDITFRQTRVLVLDTPTKAGPLRASWSLAPGVAVSLTDRTLEGQVPGRKSPVKLTLDERFTWSLVNGRVEASGVWDGDDPVKTSLEW